MMNSRLAPLAIVTIVGCFVGCSALSKHELTGGRQPVLDFDSQFAQARELERNGESARAKQVYQEILTQNPGKGAAAHRLGVLAAKQGNLSEALAHLEAAQSLDPDNSEILTDIGYVLYMQNRGNEAAEALQMALAKSPDNTRAINNLGLVLGRQGRMGEAHDMFRNVGTEAEALASIGYVYAQRGELDKAEHTFSRALDHDNDLRIAAEGLLQVHQRRRSVANTASQKPADKVATAPRPPQRDLNAMSDEDLAALSQSLSTAIDRRRAAANIQPVSHQTPRSADFASPESGEVMNYFQEAGAAGVRLSDQ